LETREGIITELSSAPAWAHPFIAVAAKLEKLQ